LQDLAVDRPGRDVDSADGAAQAGAAERPHAIHVLPVAFDLSRILAYQIATERPNDGINRLRIGPTRRLTETDMPLVSGDANKVRAAQQSDSTSAIFMRLPFPRCWLRQPSAVQARLYTGSMPPRDVHPARTAVADSRGRCPSPKGSAVRT